MLPPSTHTPFHSTFLPSQVSMDTDTSLAAPRQARVPAVPLTSLRLHPHCIVPSPPCHHLFLTSVPLFCHVGHVAPCLWRRCNHSLLCPTWPRCRHLFRSFMDRVILKCQLRRPTSNLCAPWTIYTTSNASTDHIQYGQTQRPHLGSSSRVRRPSSQERLAALMANLQRLIQIKSM